MTLTVTRQETRDRTARAVIDCDIHNAWPSEQVLRSFIPGPWKRHHDLFGGRGYSGAYYPLANMHAARTDSWPPNGGPPGSDLAFLREQLLDRWGWSMASCCRCWALAAS